MSAALTQARSVAISDTMQRAAQQATDLEARMVRAQMAGDYAEADRLRAIADAARLSYDQYRDELERITRQRRLAL